MLGLLRAALVAPLLPLRERPRGAGSPRRAGSDHRELRLPPPREGDTSPPSGGRPRTRLPLPLTRALSADCPSCRGIGYPTCHGLGLG